MYPSSSCRLMRAPMAGPKRAAILGGKKRSEKKVGEPPLLVEGQLLLLGSITLKV